MIDPAYAPQQASGIWVFLEQDDAEFAPVSVELIGKARELSRQSGAELTGLLVGHELDDLAERAAHLDLDRVVYVLHPLLSQFTAEAYAHATAGVIRECRPDIFLLGATPYGRDLAGRLAVMLRTGLTADCTDLALDPGSGLLLGEVSGFGGGVLATIKCEQHRPQMATVRPGVFAEVVSGRETAAPVERIEVDVPPAACPCRSMTSPPCGDRYLRPRGTSSPEQELAGSGDRVRSPGPWTRNRRTRVASTRDGPGANSRSASRRDRASKLAVVCGASGATQFHGLATNMRAWSSHSTGRRLRASNRPTLRRGRPLPGVQGSSQSLNPTTAVHDVR